MIELPGYTIEKQLGRGGMAKVYLARHDGLDRLVAIKVLSKDLHGDRSFSERFIREARIVASLTQQNIITVYDVGVHNEHHYIAMEYLPGETLDDKIKRKLDIRQTLNITKQIASALDYAHKKGIVHRDVKPDNILFREDGTAVLTDFGIARSTASETKMTATGTVIGTPHYMSPEQAQGQEIGAWSDLYSLGIVLFEMISGEVPFDADSTIAVVFKHISEPVPDLPQPFKQFQPLVNTLLAKEPAARYQSGREVIADIECLERGDTPAIATLIFKQTSVKQTSLNQTTLNPATIPGGRQATHTNTKAADKPPAAKLKSVAGFAIAGILAAAVAASFFYSVQETSKKENTAADQQALNLAQTKQELEKSQRELEAIAAKNTLLEQQRIEKENLQQEKLREEKRQRELAERSALDRQAKAEAEALKAKQELQALKQKQLAAKNANKPSPAKIAAVQPVVTKPKKAEPAAEAKAEPESDRQEEKKTGLFAGWLGDAEDTSSEYINDLFTAADNALATQHYASAWENYKKVLEMSPDNPRALKGLQLVQQNAASTKTDDNEDAFTADLLTAANNALETDRLSSASYNYQKVLERSPDNPQAINGLNKVFNKHLQLALEDARDNDFDDADEHIIAARKINPNDKQLGIISEQITQLKKN
jgi:serine/threonine-protein kinase PpkA